MVSEFTALVVFAAITALAGAAGGATVLYIWLWWEKRGWHQLPPRDRQGRFISVEDDE